eukprot:7436482-Alexandrium_andersonii.AAC.1
MSARGRAMVLQSLRSAQERACSCTSSRDRTSSCRTPVQGCARQQQFIQQHEDTGELVRYLGVRRCAL